MKLKIEELEVGSFATEDAARDARGAIRAHEATPRWSCQPYYTCPECAPPAFEPREG